MSDIVGDTITVHAAEDIIAAIESVGIHLWNDNVEKLSKWLLLIVN